MKSFMSSMRPIMKPTTIQNCDADALKSERLSNVESDLERKETRASRFSHNAAVNNSSPVSIFEK